MTLTTKRERSKQLGSFFLGLVLATVNPCPRVCGFVQKGLTYGSRERSQNYFSHHHQKIQRQIAIQTAPIDPRPKVCGLVSGEWHG